MLRPSLVVLLLLSACSPPPKAAGPLTVRQEPAARGARLLLIAEPGARISAEYTPTLTLDDGTIARFDTTALSSDSAYFAAPPSAMLPGSHGDIHGLVKASVCFEDEAVCRLVKLEI